MEEFGTAIQTSSSSWWRGYGTRSSKPPRMFHSFIPKILGMMDFIFIIGPRNKKVDILDANNVGHEQT